MAGGLNKEFIGGTEQFMRGNFIYAPDNGLVNGSGQFGLTEVSTRPTKSCRIGNFASTTALANSTCHGKGSHPIRGYYLLGLPNNDNSYALPNDVPFMLTMHLSGCQFMAYGPDRDHVTVEHNNYITAPGNYALRQGVVAAANHAFFFQVRPGIEYQPMQLANVVGIRGGTGWQFYLRTQAFAQPGPVTGPH